MKDMELDEMKQQQLFVIDKNGLLIRDSFQTDRK